MRVFVAAIVTTVALFVTVVPVAAQVEETAPPLTIITNEEFCGLLSEDLLACEGVITGMATARILPEAFAELVATEPPVGSPTDDSSTVPGDDGGVGDTLSREDLGITLLKVDWKPDISDVFFKPAKGNKDVSVLVRYEALQDGATYNIIFWDATDKAGTRYEATVLGPITPDLKVGDLAAGDTVQGWVTYEVPKDVDQLRIIESQVLETDLAWNIER